MDSGTFKANFGMKRGELLQMHFFRIWSPAVGEDIESIAESIDRDSPFYAKAAKAAVNKIFQ